MARVLVVCSGSVASIKVPELVGALRAGGHTVRLVPTPASLHFLPTDLATLGELGTEVLLDRDEWAAWSGRGDPVLHIDLRKWAEVVVVAPCSANTLAKISTGLADNLGTSVLRAWDLAKPAVVAPAMNTAMWEHPVTAEQRWSCT